MKPIRLNLNQDHGDLDHPRLRRLLSSAAIRLRDRRALLAKSKGLLKTLFVSAPLGLLAWFLPAYAPLFLYLIAFVSVIALIVLWLRQRRQTLDFLEAANAVEQENPSLNLSLVTAVEKNLSEPSGFFLDRVVEKALSHPSRPNWPNAGRVGLRMAQARYLGSLALVMAAMASAYFAAQSPWARLPDSGPSSLADTTLSVRPGDAEVQRGSSLVVTARFEGALPQEATLVALDSTGNESRFPMAQSLSDPVFAFTLQRIEASLRYRIEYGDHESEPYRIEVFELPDLARADASLVFPEYTQWESRTIRDTRRISAIEGSELSYTFETSQPVESAYLESEDGRRVELLAENTELTRFTHKETLDQSRRYRLHLADARGLSNAFPPEIRIDVLPNERPSLRFEAPRGDQRVSPIEEVGFKGSASDDFGLLDYGIALVFGSQSPQITSLKPQEGDDQQLNAEISLLVELEQYGLEPKDTLSWYLWAEDYDAKGEPRRSTSDLYFADVRPLDETYREQDGGGGGQGGQGNEGQQMIEKQRRISISLFRINNTATVAADAVEDLDVALRSQLEVQDQLRQLVPQLQEPSAREAATGALRFMEGIYVSLSSAMDEPSLVPLDDAWRDSQGAYQELIKLTESEYNVARSDASSAGGAGGQSRNQAQLDQLEFRQNENRYERASEAQPLASPEERQNLELMAKLNELSRRQQDMNERLQEMQQAMADAQDEEDRDRIRRELKRLEEEQRQLLAEADEAIQQSGNRQSAREARQQLEQARETMRQSAEQLQEGEVSQALASGARARETIDQTREQMRESSSSQFSEAMRQASAQASELAEQQRQLEQRLEEMERQPARRLDDSAERQAAAEQLEAQRERVSSFLQDLQEITEGSEAAEPGLHRKLYDTLRRANGSQLEESYDLSAQLLQQGFLEDAIRSQTGVTESLEQLNEGIAAAAESVLGSETRSLRFAQEELDDLTRQLEQERTASAAPQRGAEPAGNETTPATESEVSNATPASEPGAGSETEEMVRNALSGLERGRTSPLTGGGYSEWVDRLRTVESLIEEPGTRERIAAARETTEQMRRDFKRHGALPQWDMVEDEIVAPLQGVRRRLQEELMRRVSPDTLQRVDRDPVPQEYSEAVRRYYESLGQD